MMSIKDFGLLKKLMARTTSGTDNERLEAIDHANKLLAKSELTWEKVFARTVTVVDEVEASPETIPGRTVDPEKDQIDDAFDTIRGRTSGSFTTMVESIERQWKEEGWLSPKQKKTIFDARDRERGH